MRTWRRLFGWWDFRCFCARWWRTLWCRIRGTFLELDLLFYAKESKLEIEREQGEREKGKIGKERKKEKERNHFSNGFFIYPVFFSPSPTTHIPAFRKTRFVAIAPATVQSDAHKSPETFDVTRWDTAEKIDALRKDFGFLQFGYGRHRCTGERFASLEVKVKWGEKKTNEQSKSLQKRKIEKQQQQKKPKQTKTNEEGSRVRSFFCPSNTNPPLLFLSFSLLLQMTWSLLFDRFDLDLLRGADVKKDWSRAGAPLPDRPVIARLRSRSPPGK